MIKLQGISIIYNLINYLSLYRMIASKKIKLQKKAVKQKSPEIEDDDGLKLYASKQKKKKLKHTKIKRPEPSNDLNIV